MKKNSMRLVGTTDWRSFAYFRCGARLEREGDHARALEMYHRALARDTRNRGARVNLASILMEEGDSARAIEQLEKVKAEVKAEYEGNQALREPDRWFNWGVDVSDSGATGSGIGVTPMIIREPVWYSASYRLAIAYYNHRRSDLAQAELRQLLGVLDLTTHRCAEEPANANLLMYLKAVRPIAIAMLIGICDDRELVHEQMAAFDKTTPSAEVQYNLACTFSLIAGREREKALQQNAESQALWHLQFALRLAPSFQSWARRDPSLAHLRHAAGKQFEAVVSRVGSLCK